MRTDAELVKAVADGDRLHRLPGACTTATWRVTSRLARRCADQDVVAEAVQDTFVAVWKEASRWDGRRLLNIPHGTVKTRMMRARAELRGALG